MADDSPNEAVESTMPDDAKPETKPVRFVFPRGATATEIAEALREMVERHRQEQKPDPGPDDGDESEAVP